MHLTIGFPAYRRMIDFYAGVTLAGVFHNARLLGWDLDYADVLNSDSPDLDDGRNSLLARALSKNADILLSIDSDCFAKPEQIVEMIQGMLIQTVPIALIGAPCKHRGGGLNVVVEGKQLSKINSRMMFEVDAIGFGIVAFNLTWLREHWKNSMGPWIWSEYVTTTEGAKRMTHDYVFCREAKALGGRIICDSRVDAGHEMERHR
jgi:hypothetical protein